MTLAEAPGQPLRCADPGRRCVMTSTTGRIANGDKTLDRDPVRRREVVARAARRVEACVQPIHREAVIHGVRVALVTDLEHVARMFEANWFSPATWAEATGEHPPAQPSVSVYALTDPDGGPAAYYSRSFDALWFFDIAFYGQIKSWILGAVGRILADRGVHSVHGACVDVRGNGLLLIAPTGTGKSTSTYGLLGRAGTRFHSDDWVFLRFDDDSRADAYISERQLYVRTNLVESFPEAAPAFLGADVENVPPMTAALAARHGGAGRRLAAQVTRAGGPHRQPSQGLWEDLARLVAFDNGRAMIDSAALFSPETAILDPREPLPISAVVLLEQDPYSDLVLEPLDEDAFVSKLLIGRTPSGGADTAFNAYRLVDDAAERAFVDRHRERRDELVAALASPAAPATLVAEAEAFRRLHRRAGAYSLNTVLAHDGRLPLQQAVRKTIDLLVAVADGGTPDPIRLDDIRAAA